MSDSSNTDELLRSAGNGDRAAFCRVLDNYSDRLLGRIRMLLGPEARARADSNDFLQGAFVEALRDYDKRGWRTERDFLRWLTAVARNNVRDAVRRPRELAFETLSDELLRRADKCPDEAPYDAAERYEAQLRLVEAIESLPDDRRRVVELRSLDGKPLAEVAAELGRGVDATRMLHTRAILELGRRMRETD